MFVDPNIPEEDRSESDVLSEGGNTPNHIANAAVIVPGLFDLGVMRRSRKQPRVRTRIRVRSFLGRTLRLALSPVQVIQSRSARFLGMRNPAASNLEAKPRRLCAAMLISAVIVFLGGIFFPKARNIGMLAIAVVRPRALSRTMFRCAHGVLRKGPWVSL